MADMGVISASFILGDPTTPLSLAGQQQLMEFADTAIVRMRFRRPVFAVL